MAGGKGVLRSSLLRPLTKLTKNEKNKVQAAYGLLLVLSLSTSFYFLLSTPSFLSANQLKKIPHRAFYKVNPGKHQVL